MLADEQPFSPNWFGGHVSVAPGLGRARFGGWGARGGVVGSVRRASATASIFDLHAVEPHRETRSIFRARSSLGGGLEIVARVPSLALRLAKQRDGDERVGIGAIVQLD